MEAYFKMYPEENSFLVFEDGNVFFAKDRNLAEKHARDTKSTYTIVERNPKAIQEPTHDDLEQSEQSEQTKATKKTK